MTFHEMTHEDRVLLYSIMMYRRLLRVTLAHTGRILIEDVERGAELSFSGPLRGPCIIVKFCFQTTKFWFQTDGRTDGQTQ